MKLDKAIQLAAAACSRKEHCISDIKKKFERWGVSDTDIDKAIDFLLKHKFIDELRYTEAYVNDKLQFNHWGKQKIAMMLKTKQIDEKIIKEALSEIEKENIEDICLSVIKNKAKLIKEEDTYKRKNKIIRHALSKGFDYDTINRCLAKLNKDSIS